VGAPLFRATGAELLGERLKTRNVIMVSHRMGDIRKHCDVVVHVDRGNTVLYEDVGAGIATYEKINAVPA
jgi:capsular polysaccharide transport system ATP-binding protein